MDIHTCIIDSQAEVDGELLKESKIIINNKTAFLHCRTDKSTDHVRYFTSRAFGVKYCIRSLFKELVMKSENADGHIKNEQQPSGTHHTSP